MSARAGRPGRAAWVGRLRQVGLVGRAGLLVLLGLGSHGCEQPAEARAEANAAAGRATLDDRLTARVEGGAILAVTAARPDALARMRIRAQSLDVRIDLVDAGCAPRTVEITVTHLPRLDLTATFRSLLDARAPEVTAAEGALGGIVGFPGDPHDPARTPVDAELPFATGPGVGPDVRRFWVTLDRGRRQVRVDGAPPAAVPAEVGACATPDAAASGPLGQAALVARLRLRQTPPDIGYRFAVFGNVAGNLERLDALLDSVNARQPAFAVVSGDLTADGTPGGLGAAIDRLDRALTVPWYATVGDRDVANDLQGDLVLYLGRTQFAFDVGAARVVVLDSADASLSARGHAQLEDWLADAPLWWAGETPPATRVVVTHIPPFDPDGARNQGFHQRLEAGRMLAALQRAHVSWLITSQLAEYSVERAAGVPILHAGGGGAPLRDPEKGHFWVEVAVAGDCVAPQDRPRRDDACGGCDPGSRCVPDPTPSEDPEAPAGACGPCVTVQPVYF